MRRIEITTNGNSAFADNEDEEVVRILRALADRIENGWVQHSCQIHDVNGNRCGQVIVFEEGE